METIFETSPAFKGMLTVRDLLDNEGTFSFRVQSAKNLGTGYLFKLLHNDFAMILSFGHNTIVLQRNETVSVLTLDDIPETGNIMFFVMWDYSELTIECKFGSGVNDRKLAKVPTVPCSPPNSLIKWARTNNLIKIEEYSTEEEFRNKIHSCLQSIQDKIIESRTYYPFWNIQYEGHKIVSRTPKNETEIQPLIQGLLSDQLIMSTIEIIPEFKGGYGDLDFLFISKLKNDGFAYFCAEFKNAHSQKLEDGLLKQLLLYMKDKNAKYGAYCVLDYRGEFFKLPKIDHELDIYLALLISSSKNPFLDNVRPFIYTLSKPNTASKI
jgi:hypothetical protein